MTGIGRGGHSQCIVILKNELVNIIIFRLSLIIFSLIHLSGLVYFFKSECSKEIYDKFNYIERM